MPNDAWRFFSMGQAKGNLAPPGVRRLFKLESVDLGNAQPPTYPHGDAVQVVVPFTPTSGPMTFSDAVLRAAEIAIGAAQPPLSPHPQSPTRYAVPVIAEAIGPHLPPMTPTQGEGLARAVLEALVGAGRVAVVKEGVPKRGRGGPNRKNVFVVVQAPSPMQPKPVTETIPGDGQGVVADAPEAPT